MLTPCQTGSLAPRQAGEQEMMANPNPRIRGKERIWSTHSTEERDAGAEADGSRNYAELPSLVRNSRCRAVRGLWDRLGSVLKAREVLEETRVIPLCPAAGT